MLVPVAPACNPSYPGGRDQENWGSKPAWANSSTRPYLKKTHHKKRDGGLAQGTGPEFKSQYYKKVKKKKKKTLKNPPLSLLLFGFLLQ
jgi:hypothetical protein